MATRETKGISLGDGEVVRSTEKALFVQLESGEELWIPRSVIHDDSEVFDGEDNSAGDVVVAEWFAEKEGLA